MGELSRQWKRPRAGFEVGGERWDFSWGARRFERTATLAGRTSMVATNTSLWRDRWRVEGDLTCTAAPRRTLSRTLVLRDLSGELGSVSQPLIWPMQVRLELVLDLPVGQAAFLLWVLEGDARSRFNPIDVLAGTSS